MTTCTVAPAKFPKGTSVTTTGMKTIVNTASKMVSAISFGSSGDSPLRPT